MQIQQELNDEINRINASIKCAQEKLLAAIRAKQKEKAFQYKHVIEDLEMERKQVIWRNRG